MGQALRAQRRNNSSRSTHSILNHAQIFPIIKPFMLEIFSLQTMTHLRFIKRQKRKRFREKYSGFCTKSLNTGDGRENLLIE